MAGAKAIIGWLLAAMMAKITAKSARLDGRGQRAQGSTLATRPLRTASAAAATTQAHWGGEQGADDDASAEHEENRCRGTTVVLRKVVAPVCPLARLR